MEQSYTADKIFEKSDFTITPLIMGDYESCQFINCNFSGTDISGIHFSDCLFTRCNVANATLAGTTFSDIQFRECKMPGLHFETCNHIPFKVSFHYCLLQLSSFYQMKLKKMNFIHTHLHETDFTEADLTLAVFEHCDLTGAIFDNTILEKADLHTSFNYSIDPERNKLKKAVFSVQGLSSLLDKYDIVIKG